MEKIKKFLRIEHAYKFELNDLRALLNVINVALIIFCSFSVGATFGLIIATIGLIKDLVKDRHINGMVLHIMSIILNVYILTL